MAGIKKERDPLGILQPSQDKESQQFDPLGILKKKADGQDGGQELEKDGTPPTPLQSQSKSQNGEEKPSWQTSALNPLAAVKKAEEKKAQEPIKFVPKTTPVNVDNIKKYEASQQMYNLADKNKANILSKDEHSMFSPLPLMEDVAGALIPGYAENAKSKRYREITKADQDLETTRKNAMASQNAIKEEIPKILSPVSDKWDEFISYTIDKVPKIDEYKIRNFANETAKKYGVQENGMFYNLIKREASNLVTQKLIQPEVDKALRANYKKTFGRELDVDLQSENNQAALKLEEIKTNAKLSANKLQNQISLEARDKVSSISTDITNQVNALNDEIKIASEGINNKYSSLIKDGKFIGTPEEYAQYQQDFTALQQKEKENKDLFTSLNKKFLDEQNLIFNKANARYRREAEEISKIAQSQYEKFKPKANPQLQKNIEKLYSKSYDEVLRKHEDLRRTMASFNTPMDNFTYNLVSSIGGQIKGLGASAGLEGVVTFGEFLQNSYAQDVSEFKSAKDYLDYQKLAKWSGQIVGGMLPGMVGAAAVTAATGGSAAPIGWQMVSAGLTQWAAETYSNAGNIKADILAATGDIAKANNAERQTIAFQKDILPLYSFSGLPFIGKPVSKLISKYVPSAVRMTSPAISKIAGIAEKKWAAPIIGGLAETLEELPQEYSQNLSEEAIRKEGSYANMFDYHTKEKLQNTALNIAPMFLFGGAGELMGQSEETKKQYAMQQAAKSFALQTEFAKLAPGQKEQFLFDVIQRQGAPFAAAYLTANYSSGQIDKAEFENLQQTYVKQMDLLGKTQELGLTPVQAKLYNAFSTYHENEKKRFDETEDPILKTIAGARMAEYQKALTDIAMQKEPNYSVVTYPNNTQMVFMHSELENALNQPAFATAVANGDIKVGVFGESEKLNTKLEETKKSVVAAQEEEKKVSKQEEANTRKEIEVEFNVQIEDNVGEMGVEVNGLGTEEQTEQAKQALRNAGIKLREDVTENVTGLPSQVGEGQELVATEPQQGAGTEATSTGGVLQAQGVGGQVQGVGQKVLAPISVSNKTELTGLEQRTQSDKNKSAVLASAKKAIATLKSVFPDMDIFIHEDGDAYNKTMEQLEGTQNSRGNFAFERDKNNNPTGRGRIDINLSNASVTTVAHEVTHAVLLKAFGDSPATFKQFRDRISPILRADLNEELLKFEEMYAGQEVAPEEYLTQLSALLSKGAETVEYKPSTLRKIAAVINEFVAKITGGKFQPFKGEVDFKNFVDFLNQMSGAIREGGKIDLGTKESGDAIISGVVSLEKIKNKSDLGYKKHDVKWVVSEDSGITLNVPKDKKSMYDVVEKSGGAVVVINSDATGIGVTKDNDLLQGGIGYTFIDANVLENIGFAASNDGKISSFYEAVMDAAIKRDAEFPEFKGKPVAVFVMVQTPAAMFGNTYAAEYFGRVLNKITTSKLFDTKEAKKELIDFIEDYKVNNKTGKKYENSLDKLISLIKTTDFSKKESIKKLTDLLITNRASKEDKSAKFGFDIRRSFFEKFFVGVGTVKEGAPARNLRLKLKEKGYNHQDFFEEFGDNNVMSLLEGDTPGRKLADGNFTLTGFYVDPYQNKENYIQNSKKGTYQHKQFNSKFYGIDPYVLDGKYYVDKMFPEARFTSQKTGEEVPVQVAAAGSLYPRTQKSAKQIIERAKELKSKSLIPEQIKANDTIVSKSQKEKLDNELKQSVEYKKESGTTQVATTTGSYEKAAKLLKSLGIKGDVLDYGAGLGLGSDAMSNVFGFDVDSFEPNSERWKGRKNVTFRSSNDINKKYNSIVSLNVLNVVEKDIRDSIVKDIYNHLDDGGIAAISTRKWNGDVNQAKNAVSGGEKNSLYITRTQNGKEVKVFQKGFDGNELVDYISDLLGDKVTVEKNNTFGASGVIIKKKGELVSKAQLPQQKGEGVGEMDTKKALEKYPELKTTKIVDEEGNPLIVRHQSQSDIDITNMSDRKKGGIRDILGRESKDRYGMYFTTEGAESLKEMFDKTGKGKTYEVYLDVKNPLILEGTHYFDFETNKPVPLSEDVVKNPNRYLDVKDMSKNDIERLKALGYDGVWGNKNEGNYKGIDEIVVFDKSKIKPTLPQQKGEGIGEVKTEEGSIKSKSEVEAYHGSPYDFEKFTTEKIGTGEGAQAFGYGLYFTDLKGIAKGYADTISTSKTTGGREGYYSEKEFDEYLSTLTNDEDIKKWAKSVTSEFFPKLNNTYYHILHKDKKGRTFIDIVNDLYQNPKVMNLSNDKFEDIIGINKDSFTKFAKNFERYVYKVSIHEGKTPDQYTFLEWDKPFKKNISEKVVDQFIKEGLIDKSDRSYSIDEYMSKDGATLYKKLSQELGGDKAASEFLLRAGIDGIKYPAESISRGATSETARGFNYVVFDEGAVTIKSKSEKTKVDFGEGEEGKDNKKEFDKLTSTIPNSGEVTKYLSGETIEKYEGEKPRNEQEVVAQQLRPALERGVDIIEKAKELFGDEYVEKLLQYVETENLPPANKALIYVSLENEIAKQKIENPSEAAKIEKMQDLVRAKSQAFLRSNSLAINMGRLRKFAEVGYDVNRLTDRFFSSRELEDKGKIESALQATADDINKEAERIIADEENIKAKVDEGVKEEIQKIYENLSTEKKKTVDKRLSVLEKIKQGLFSKYTFKSKPQLVEENIKSKSSVSNIIEEGYNKIFNAIKAGIEPSKAIGIGIDKIKENIEKTTGQAWADEAEFRKDMTEAFKAEGVMEGKTNEKSQDQILKEQQRKLEAEINRQLNIVLKLKEKLARYESGNLDETDVREQLKDVPEIEELKQKVKEAQSNYNKKIAEEKKIQDNIEKLEAELERVRNRKEKTPKEKTSEVRQLSEEEAALANKIKEENDAWAKEKENAKKLEAQYKALETERNRQLERVSILKEKLEALKRGEKPQKNAQEVKLDTPEIEGLKADIKKEEKRLAEAEAKKEKTIAERLAEAKARIKNQIQSIQEQIANKQRVEKRDKLKPDAELENLIKQRDALNSLLDKYVPKVDAYADERNLKAAKTKLENEILALNRQIQKGQKDKFEKKESQENSELDALRAEKEARQAILEALDPTPRLFIENTLIEQGFGRQINVKTKDGVEKRWVLDWKKLAGEEGSVDNIRERVESALRDKGYTEEQILRMQDAFVEEYNNLSQSIVEKALNEINARNKQATTPEQKSAVRKLVEMYNYGLFDKDPSAYETALAKTLGLTGLSLENFERVRELGEVLSNLFNSNFEGKPLNESQLRTAIQVIEEKMRVILNSEAMQQGGTAFKLSEIVKGYMDASQRMMLNTIKQGVENPISGLLERFYSSIGYAGTIPEQLNAQQRKMARDIYKEMVLQKGLGYGNVGNAFISKGSLDAHIHNMSDSELVQGIMSIAMGKTILDAVDSAYKSKITQQKFTYNLIKILTKDRMVNGKLEKGMSKEEAKRYVAEKISGQSFEDAQDTAFDIIDKINSQAGKKILNDSPEFISRLATDIVNAALVNGEKITEEMVTAAYNAAYRAAGRGLGHVANNPISEQINTVSGKLESRITDAIKQKKFAKATYLNLYSIFYRNIANPFVGGGTNWIVLKAEKAGLGLISGLISMYKDRGSKMDLMTDTGMKELEDVMFNSMKTKDKFIRGAVGGAVTALAFMLIKATGADDEYEKWIKKNQWAKKYLSILTPEIMLAMLAARQKGAYTKYLESSFNKNESFDKGKMAIKAASYLAAGEKEKAAGQAGQLVGSSIGTPIPWRLVRDGQQIWVGATGGEPYAINPASPNTFAEGYLKGGFVDYLGYAPTSEDKSTIVSAEELSSPAYKVFKEKEIKMPKVGERTSYEIPASVRENKQMTEDEFNKFSKSVKEYELNGWVEVNKITKHKTKHYSLKEILDEKWKIKIRGKMPKTVLGRDLPKEDLQNKVNQLHSDAVEKAKEDLGFIKDEKEKRKVTQFKY